MNKIVFLPFLERQTMQHFKFQNEKIVRGLDFSY